MKAQVLHDYGDVDQFELENVDAPEAQASQVRISVRAIGLNPMETKICTGALKDEMPTEFPAILGSDVAGEVDQVGDNVTSVGVGDRVVGLASNGAYADYAVAHADIVAKIPDGLDFARAVTIPTAAETSQRMSALVDPAQGETVVVNGAVGSATAQLLVGAGVRVIGTASEDNHDYLRSLGLGAEPTTYGEGVVDRIRELALDGVDAFLDVTDHGFVDAAIELRGGTDRIVGADFAPVLDFAAAGDFVTEIANTFAFKDIPAAHQLQLLEASQAGV